MLDNANARAFWARIINPIAGSLIKLKVTPDTVTVLGAGLSVLTAFIFIPTGHLLAGAIILGICSLSDLLDGTMARQLGTASKWGAFLDSTLDRVVDASLLIAIALYFSHHHPVNNLLIAATIIALTAGQLISYIRARAEALGVEAKVGIAERAERTLIIWGALIFTGLGFNVLPAAIYLLALICIVTVVQRVIHVRKQLA